MTTNESGVEFEAKHVHEVYDEIAEQFSDTRYKVRLIHIRKVSAYKGLSVTESPDGLY